MRKFFLSSLVFLSVFQVAAQHWQPQKSKQYIILSEQAKSRVAIADVEKQVIVWEWYPAAQADIAREHVGWFSNMSDAKLVKNKEYILACASGGGVALIRIADKKTVFYAYAGGNTHSVELLPDGNIVSASSTGNLMRLFVYDEQNFPDNISFKDCYLYDGHNVVWDSKRKLLYTVSDKQFMTYTYNPKTPLLTLKDSVGMPDGGAHDLVMAYGNQFLWLSSNLFVYKVSLPGKKTEQVVTSLSERIKSVSSGPRGYPTILIQPKESWWTDEVFDVNGNSIFKLEGLQIYKARWFL